MLLAKITFTDAATMLTLAFAAVAAWGALATVRIMQQERLDAALKELLDSVSALVYLLNPYGVVTGSVQWPTDPEVVAAFLRQIQLDRNKIQAVATRPWIRRYLTALGDSKYGNPHADVSELAYSTNWMLEPEEVNELMRTAVRLHMILLSTEPKRVPSWRKRLGWIDQKLRRESYDA